jgi:hypothetical protein
MFCSASLVRVRAAAGLLAAAGVEVVLRWRPEGAAGDAALQRATARGPRATGRPPAAPYAVAVAADPARSARAVYRLATVEAAGSACRAAVALHRLYTRLEPRDADGFVGLARTLAWAARWEAALAV